MGKFNFTGVVLILPAVLLGIYTCQQVPAAFAVDRAFPVPMFITMNVPLPQSAYRKAEAALVTADPRDGQSGISAAEAGALDGKPASTIVSRLSAALTAAPASGEGWILLAESQSRSDPKRAANSLSVALELAPFEYFLAERQSLLAAKLWTDLPEDSRAIASRQARDLWRSQGVAYHLEATPILMSAASIELMHRAFAESPVELRNFDLWAEQQTKKQEAP